MTKRTFDISGFDATLTAKHHQIQVGREGYVVGQFPANEVGLLLIDTPNTEFSSHTLLEVVESGGLVVLCGKDHLPAAYVVPVTGNELQRQRMQVQLDATVPQKKRLWQQVVEAKARNQAAACEEEEARRKLVRLSERVRSGDPENIEAQAARVYWGAYLKPDEGEGGKPFRRQREGDAPNLFLNYGYMVLRASVARALCGAGLNAALGIHHSNRSNAFCLADDLVEPFRPWVDVRARELYRSGARELNKDAKRELLGALYASCRMEAGTSSLQSAFEPVAYSLLRSLEAGQAQLDLPGWC